MDESRILADAVALVWPDEPASDVAAIEPELIDALRDLDGAALADAEQVHDRIFELLRGAPALEERVQFEIESMLLVAERGVEPGPAVPTSRRSEVRVVFATDRRPTGAPDAVRRYGDTAPLVVTR
jgi:hypothetical protein